MSNSYIWFVASILLLVVGALAFNATLNAEGQALNLLKIVTYLSYFFAGVTAHKVSINLARSEDELA